LFSSKKEARQIKEQAKKTSS
jgi:hypothetical protein